MIKVKMFFTENGDIHTTEKIFADFAMAVKFFADVQRYIVNVSHAKLICHRRVVDEF